MLDEVPRQVGLIVESDVDGHVRQFAPGEDCASRQIDSTSRHVLVRRKPEMLREVLDQIRGLPLQDVRRFPHRDSRCESRIEQVPKLIGNAFVNGRREAAQGGRGLATFPSCLDSN